MSRTDESFLVVSGYDRRKNKEQIRVRFMTLSEVKELRVGQEVDIISGSSMIRTVRVNGRVRRWKRDENRVEVPFKYGLKECFTLSGRECLARLVVRVELGPDECGTILEETFDRT